MSAGDTFAGGLSVINPLIGIGFNLLGVLLSHFKKTQAAPQVLTAVQAAMDALEAHALDIMTKEQWESLRG